MSEDTMNQTTKDAVLTAPVELEGVAEVLENGDGFWRTCDGCHETEDGHPVGHYPFSAILKCDLGGGCSECGGIGAVWDDTDYGAMADAWDAQEIAREQTEEAQAPIDYDRVVQICEAHGIGLPIDSVEMVVEIIRHAAPVAPTAAEQAEAVRADQVAIIKSLIEAVRATFIALDDSEEGCGDDGRMHVIDSTNFDAVCAAMDLLEELPDDRPGYTMDAPGKAEWALRNLLAARSGDDAVLAGNADSARYIVIGYGESDHPQAAYVNEREQLLDAVLGMIYTSPADADEDYRAAVKKDIHDDDEWSADGIWRTEFEIGGIVIYDLGESALAATAPSDAEKKS
jgi:hypothetical protein